MSHAKCKTESKFVLKSGFKIPMEDERDTDSMLNCEVMRIEKLINQTLTHPILASKLCHITSLFKTKNLGLNVKTTQNLINGLKIRNCTKTKTLSNSNRMTIDSRTNKLSQKYSFLSDSDLKKLKAPLEKEKNRFFDLQEPDMEDYCETSNGNKNSLNNYNSEQSDCNVLALSAVKDNGKRRRRRKATKHGTANNRVLKHVSGILHKLSCKKEKLSRIRDSKRVSTRIQQSKPGKSEEFNLINYLNTHKETKSLVKTFMISNPSKQASIIAGFKDGFDKLLENSLGADLFIQIYTCQKKLQKSTIELISQIDFVKPAFSVVHTTLIHILSNLNTEESEIDIVYSQFNNADCWTNMVSHKYGRNLVEYFLSNTYVNDSYKHFILFKVLEDNFVHFAQSNYSTFVIQIYVKCYHKPDSFAKIITNFNELTVTRNGIFVVISALKGYSKSQLEALIDKIILHSEKLCTNVYASTLIEFVFKNFELAISKFLSTKLHSLFGKPNKLFFIFFRDNGGFLW